MQTQTCPAPAKPPCGIRRSASGGRAPHLPHARSARNAGAVRIRGRSRANGPRVGAAPQLNPVAELDGAGVLTWQYVYGSKPNVPDYAIRVSDGARYRIVSDQLGSVVLVVNVADARDVVFAGRYDAFGELELIAGSAEEVPFGFAGGRYDAETGLVRFGARDYDPETGRWTGKDTARWDGRRTNLFVYARSDPCDYVDTNGQSAVLVVTVAVGTAAADGPLPFGDAVGICILGAYIGLEFASRTCPPCPTPPDPEEHWDHSHWPCGPHWHYYEYNQNPVTCTCYLKKKLGGCL